MKFISQLQIVWPEFCEMNNVHNKWLLRAAILLFNSNYNDPEYLKIYKITSWEGHAYGIFAWIGNTNQQVPKYCTSALSIM